MRPGTSRVTQTLPRTNSSPVSKASFVAGRDSSRQSEAANAFGSMLDMESLLAGELEAEKSIFANELLSRMSTFSQTIVNRRWNGYTWREIGGELEMDHTAVRRAYLRELESLLQGLSRSGDSPKCD